MVMQSMENMENKCLIRNVCAVGESALGQGMPWASRLFLKSMKRKILNFVHEVEKLISAISIQG